MRTRSVLAQSAIVWLALVCLAQQPSPSKEENPSGHENPELPNHRMLMNLGTQLPPEVVRVRVVTRDSANGNMGATDLTPEGEQFH
jgi:hypothetical protein